MPTYVYETIPDDPTEIPVRFEVRQSIFSKPLEKDPESGLPVRRVISGGLGFFGGSHDSDSDQGCRPNSGFG